MARAAKRRGDQVSVEELKLRGEDRPSADVHRERLERQARQAAYDEQRAGTRIRLVTAISGAAVVVGSLIMLGTNSTSSPVGQTALSLESLRPATAPPATTSAQEQAPPPLHSEPPVSVRMSASQSTDPPSTSAANPPPAPPPSPSCVVHYSVQSQWDDGFTGSVQISNTGSAPISPWSLGWSFTGNQHVTQGWDGTFSQSGNRVTVTAASWNTDIAPSSSVSAGFNASFRGDNLAPAGFTLNGAACGVG